MADRVRTLASGGGGGQRRSLSLGAMAVAVVAVVAAFTVGRVTAPSRNVAPPSTLQSPASTTVGASAPGPAKVVDGVGVGYPHTKAGAVASLLDDGQTLGDPRVLFDPRRRSQVLSLIATPRYARTFSGSGGRALAQAERQTALGRGIMSGARTVYLAVPVAYRVRSYSPRAITVVGYGVSVVANARGLSPRATWATSTTTAVWQHGGWRVDTASSADGPTPAMTDQASSAAQFLGALGSANEVHDAP